MPAPPVRRLLAFAVALLFAAPLTQAQWSDSAADNLVLADRATGQAQPKLVATPDGGFYASWFGGGGDGYDVYLQRLDADGEPLWADGGIRVADRSFSSTEDYGLAVDPDGHAVLAFRFPDGEGRTQIVASRVTPDGTLAWGTPGVFVSAETSAAASPRIAALTDGSVVVGWTSFSTSGSRFQRLDPAGAPLWAAGGVSLTGPSGALFLADLRAAADGHVIAAFSAQLSFSDRRFWAQKLDTADGAPLWGASPVQVSNGSDGVLQLGYFPTFVADDEGGAVFAWYQVAGVSAARVRVQHIDAAGQPAFPQNGIDVSTNTDRQHLSPSVAYDAALGDIYVAWSEDRQEGQNRTFGVAAQRIDAEGTRRWTNTGLVLSPLSATATSGVNALAYPGGVLVAWTLGSSPNPMQIRAARLAASGSPEWTPESVALKTAPDAHARMQGAFGRLGFAAYAWTQGTDGSASQSVRVQNVDLTGALGPVSPPALGLSAEALMIGTYTGGTGSTAFDLSNLASAGNDLVYTITLDAPDLPALTLTASPRAGTLNAGVTVPVELTFDATELDVEATYSFELRLATNDPERLDVVVEGTIFVITAGTEPGGDAARAQLLPGYPSPSVGDVLVPVVLARPGLVHLAVYDAAGRRVATLVDAAMPTGRHDVRWQPHLAAGVYHVRLLVDGTPVAVQRVTLLGR